IKDIEDKENSIKENILVSEKSLEEKEIKEEIVSNVEFKVGMDVLCGPNKREGTIVKSDKKGSWVVAIGPMKFTIKEKDLTIPKRSLNVSSYTFEVSTKNPMPKMNLDLRGYRLLEAIDTLDSQIESCCIYGLKSFSIVHGYGDGILSSGIQKHLNNSPLVESYRYAIPEDGGQGKTYVTLK
ncbi:MAG: Smr/MutS family protein, partial [Sphaerochaetaceae bacterium]|nr:Smr/MutS family protein [Sphaerochaetaceae bacterium]